MTAIRKGVAILALSAAWLVAASLLWRTRVPADLHLAKLDPGDFFSARELDRHERYEGVLRWLFFPAVLPPSSVSCCRLRGWCGGWGLMRFSVARSWQPRS
jgi:hypothetical protein